MRKFLLKLALFLAPLAGVWLFMEWKLDHMPNTLSQKRALLEQHAPDLRVLVVGTSIEDGGIAPSQFCCDGMNMANPFQTIFLNAEIVQHFAPSLPQLRLVLFGITYGAFEAQLGDSPAGQAVYLYRHFLGTHLDGGVTFWDPRSFSMVAAFGQEIALGQLLSGFNLPITDQFDDHGWSGTDGKFDISREADIVPLLDRLQVYLKPEHVAENLHALEDMLTLLQARHVETVFITPPATAQVLGHLDTTRLERTQTTLAEVAARYHTPYIDYLRDSRFGAEDFKDPLHLNTNGALKFSRILSEEVIQPRGLCQAAQDEVPHSRPGALAASQPP